MRSSPARAAAETKPNPNTLGARTYNVRDYGAKGDGITLDTRAVQIAIDACTADRGGTVLIPAGDFLIGTVELKSHVTLHLAAHGRLLGSPRPDDYAAANGVPPDNGNEVLLYAANAENVTIEGPGTIDGQGSSFYTGHGDGTGPGGAAAQPSVNRVRPHLLVFYRCTQLTLRHAFFTRSAYHCCRLLQCQFVRIDGIRIHNRVNLNNDGFHFNSSQYVHIENCRIACQDDACALFGSNKFVTVTNCAFSTRWSVFRFGGGEAENITVSNCVIDEAYGCPIKLRCGARSRLENLLFSNLILKDVTGPISIGLDSRTRRPQTDGASTKGIVRNISFQGIRATVVREPRKHADMPFDPHIYPGETKTCIVINAVNGDVVENITFSDVHVTYEGGGTKEDAAIRDVPQVAGEYFQIGQVPAYGMYARNVKGLTLDNVRVEVADPDLRPAVVFDHVEDAHATTLSAAGNPEAESVLRFIDTRDVLLTAPRVLTPATTFLQVEGADTGNITIDGGDIAKATKPITAINGATETVARRRS
jgi:polygalacturonase